MKGIVKLLLVIMSVYVVSVYVVTVSLGVLVIAGLIKLFKWISGIVWMQ
jgi:hypothetical protein